jgi:hypothetical protein
LETLHSYSLLKLFTYLLLYPLIFSSFNFPSSHYNLLLSKIDLFIEEYPKLIHFAISFIYYILLIFIESYFFCFYILILAIADTNYYDFIYFQTFICFYLGSNSYNFLTFLTNLYCFNHTNYHKNLFFYFFVCHLMVYHLIDLISQHLKYFIFSDYNLEHSFLLASNFFYFCHPDHLKLYSLFLQLC